MKNQKAIKAVALVSFVIIAALFSLRTDKPVQPAKAAVIEDTCRKVGAGYDCTTSSTEALVLGLAKTHGISWHDVGEFEMQVTVDKFSAQYPEAKKEVIKSIVQTAKNEKYDNLDYLMKLIKCESQFKPWNTNSKGNVPKSSTDRGLLMWNSYWQKSVSNDCAFDTVCATQKAIEYIKAGKQNLWTCDRLIK